MRKNGNIIYGWYAEANATKYFMAIFLKNCLTGGWLSDGDKMITRDQYYYLRDTDPESAEKFYISLTKI